MSTGTFFVPNAFISADTGFQGLYAARGKS